MKKKTIIIIAISAAAVITVCAIFGAIALSKWMFPGDYEVCDDEIALYLKLDTKEDIGLIVFDYTADGHEYSGGVSNADKSMIKRDDVIINVWSKRELECEDDTVYLTFKFRIITEYTEPNYENVYPAKITRYLETLSWKAEFGRSYDVMITGDRTNGYKASVSAREGD